MEDPNADPDAKFALAVALAALQGVFVHDRKAMENVVRGLLHNHPGISQRAKQMAESYFISSNTAGQDR